MTAHLLTPPVKRWVCPNCDHTDITRETKPHTRMHPCAGANGMTMPMVPPGLDCKVETTEREDYVGAEIVQTDDSGRPIMNARITREDGDDVFVFAPTARFSTREQ